MSLRGQTYQAEDGAFEQLYGRYAQNVFRYALTVLGQQADAEDATQTTFLNAYRAYQRGERPLQPERWLISIAHNTCRERYRYAQRRPREVSLDEALTIAGIQDDERTTAEELRQALMILPDSQRAALVMRELEGRSYAETAAALHISGSALETLLFRARATLREQLDEQLSCHEAADAVSKQLEGTLSTGDRRILRAHLRICEECASLARSRRAQKRTRGGLSSLPSWIGRLLPSGLTGTSATGGMGAAGVVLKAAAAAVVVGGTAGGVALEGAAHPAAFATHRAVPHIVAGAPTATVRRSASGRPVVAVSGAGVSAGTRPAANRPAGETTAAADPLAASTTNNAIPPAQTSATTTDAATTETTTTETTTNDATTPAATTTETATTTTAATTDAPAAAPTDTTTTASPANAPPGQAKKDAAAAVVSTSADSSASSSAAPGQAKKDAAASTTDTTTTTTPSPNVPPGQAKKDAAAAVASTSTDSSASSSAPPGQAKKDAAATSDTSSGNGKKNGNGP